MFIYGCNDPLAETGRLAGEEQVAQPTAVYEVGSCCALKLRIEQVLLRLSCS